MKLTIEIDPAVIQQLLVIARPALAILVWHQLHPYLLTLLSA